MGRSSKKGPYVDPRLYEKVEKQLAGSDREPIKTANDRRTRRLPWLPPFALLPVGLTG